MYWDKTKSTHPSKPTSGEQEITYAPAQTNYRRKTLEHYNNRNLPYSNNYITPSTTLVSVIGQLLFKNQQCSNEGPGSFTWRLRSVMGKVMEKILLHIIRLSTKPPNLRATGFKPGSIS